MFVFVFLLPVLYFALIPPIIDSLSEIATLLKRPEFLKDNTVTMHFFDFILLNEDEQLEMLWYNGEQIGRRKQNEFLILLYQVEGFYVEVYYNTKYREIEKYLSFECTDKLEPYIRDIDLDIVYKCLKKTPKHPQQFVDGVIEQTIHRRIASKGLWNRLKMIFGRETPNMNRQS